MIFCVASHSSMTSKIFIQGTEAPWVRTVSPEISMGTMTSRDATNGFTKDLVQGVHVCPFTGPGDIHGPTHYLAWQHLHLHFKKLICRIMQNQIAVQPKRFAVFFLQKKNSKKTPLLSPSPKIWLSKALFRTWSSWMLQRHGIQGNML